MNQVGESVNCKFTDGKFYGAYIHKVNDDGTYDIYYPEDSMYRENVVTGKIKAPMMKGKSSLHWDKWVGKTFYDDGGKDEKGKFFNPGEFTVRGATTDCTFICCRKDEKGEEYIFDIGWVIRQIRKYEEE